VKALLLGLLVGAAACSVWAGGCYKGNPPCDPTTVDWPRCRPWDPPMAPHDAGVDR
jgi:hypothetical protein